MRLASPGGVSQAFAIPFRVWEFLPGHQRNLMVESSCAQHSGLRHPADGAHAILTLSACSRHFSGVPYAGLSPDGRHGKFHMIYTGNF